MVMSDTARKQQQLRAMERKRFGFTRAEVMKAKGAKCSIPLQGPDDYHQGDLTIDHIRGGGRHDTERGLMIEGKTKNMSNLRVVCRRHGGMIDRRDFTSNKGRNSRGNPNNPRQ